MSDLSQPPQTPRIPKSSDEGPANTPQSGQSNAGLWTLILGLLFAFSPVFLASTSTPAGGNMYDESSGGGAALWLLMATIPLGGFVALIGLVIMIGNKSKKK